jgi:integrase
MSITDEPMSSEAPALADGVERESVGDRVTIYRDLRISPNWYAQFSVDGKQFRPSLKTRSKKRALELARKRDAELVLGIAETPASKRSATINAAIEKYLRSLKDRGRDPKTLIIYARDLGQLESFSRERGVTKLRDLTADLLEEFQRLLLSKGYRTPEPADLPKRRFKSKLHPNAPRTVRSKMKTIRQLIRFALKRRMMAEDPSPGYFLPAAIKTQANCWSPQELKAILDYADPLVKEMFDFLRYTGLRSQELCWLTKEDLDLVTGQIKIRRKTCPQTGQTWRPKHGNERTLPLCTEALAVAKKAFSQSPGPWLFYAPDTGRKRQGHWQSQRLWRLLKKAMREAKVTKGTIHTFRHVFCSFLANRAKDKVAPFQVMKLMGHGSMDIVLMYYHAGDQELSAAISGVDFGTMLQSAGGELGK